METKFKLRLPFMKNSRAAKKSAAAHKSRLGKDPYFDWTVILGLFIAMAVLCVSFAFALWHEVSSGSFSSVSATSEASSGISGASLNTTALEQVITTESTKASTASEYERGYPGPADPSI